MIKQIKVFTVICDKCGKDANAGPDDNNVGYADNAKDAEELATDWSCSGVYEIIDGKHYCDDCWTFNEETDEIEVRK